MTVSATTPFAAQTTADGTTIGQRVNRKRRQGSRVPLRAVSTEKLPQTLRVQMIVNTEKPHRTRSFRVGARAHRFQLAFAPTSSYLRNLAERSFRGLTAMPYAAADSLPCPTRFMSRQPRPKKHQP